MVFSIRRSIGWIEISDEEALIEGLTYRCRKCGEVSPQKEYSYESEQYKKLGICWDCGEKYRTLWRETMNKLTEIIREEREKVRTEEANADREVEREEMLTGAYQLGRSWVGKTQFEREKRLKELEKRKRELDKLYGWQVYYESWNFDDYLRE